jgi:hypothetical protein
VKGVNDYAAKYWSSNDNETQERYKQSLLIHGLGDYAINGKTKKKKAPIELPPPEMPLQNPPEDGE